MAAAIAAPPAGALLRGLPRHQRAPRKGVLPAAPRPHRAAAIKPCCSLTVRDESAGVEFNVAQRFWIPSSGDMRCLGAATRSKKILLLAVKVYSVACYVEAARCAKELGVRSRGGYFQNDDDFCSAVLDGAFHKALLVRLVRDVDGSTFGAAINDTLAPRMRLAGQSDKLEEFKRVFQDQKLSEGTEVCLAWNVASNELGVCTTPPGSSRDYASMQPQATITSQALCRGLFEMFLGESSVVPAARAVWAKGAKSLLESDNVNRADIKKGGSG